MFQLKIQVFFTELLSVLLTPWILFFSLPPCSATIIDFFREFTVHVDGIGYVCSFAVFDFQLHGASGVNIKSNDQSITDVKDKAAPASTTGSRKRQPVNRDYKMEKSFLHFKATHPDWQPDLNGSMFLDKVSTYQPKAKSNTQSQAGGRGLGLDPESRGDGRVKSYDRAWSKGSHLLRPRRGREIYDSRLETMREDEDDDGEVGDGWDNRPDDGSGEEEEEGFMRDAGVVGLLQQVMNR
jgi:autophagy-related protein 9